MRSRTEGLSQNQRDRRSGRGAGSWKRDRLVGGLDVKKKMGPFFYRRGVFFLTFPLMGDPISSLLPGYIYPKDQRPVRDLLRRRLLFVKHSTAHILSLQSMIARNLGTRMSVNAIKKLTEADADDLFDSPHLGLAAKSNIEVITHLKKIVKSIEKEIMSQIKLRKEFKLLLTIPGIGNILALTIMLEAGDINRFAKVGNYSSYCRCVKSERLSNGKKKGENNRKNGNRYLSWAYVEAANFAIRFCPKAQRFYQRKKAKTNGIVAIKALSNKLARASYYVMRDQVPYDVSKLFG